VNAKASSPGSPGHVVVLGSANADLVVEVERRPSAGETLIGSDLQLYPGGKGANQAAAAARAGAKTRFVGCMGEDSHATFLRARLEEAGVDVSGVRTVPRPTGTATIIVTPDGDNSIVVSPGANGAVDVEMADAMAPLWSAADVIVLNLEVPARTVEHVAARAAALGMRVLINAAPAVPLLPSALSVSDPLIVNEHEAATMLGSDGGRSFEELAHGLIQRGARSVVITLGGAGALIADLRGVETVPAYPVDVVDTTGAGDAFVGAVAAELARGVSLRESVQFATAMSALAVQTKGAQPSYVDRALVERFIASDGGHAA
jgi:ribokinase